MGGGVGGGVGGGLGGGSRARGGREVVWEVVAGHGAKSNMA